MEVSKSLAILEVMKRIENSYGEGETDFILDDDIESCMGGVINMGVDNFDSNVKDKILYHVKRLGAKKNKMNLKHFTISEKGTFFCVENIK